MRQPILNPCGHCGSDYMDHAHVGDYCPTQNGTARTSFIPLDCAEDALPLTERPARFLALDVALAIANSN
jgi:hypothetical protein